MVVWHITSYTICIRWHRQHIYPFNYFIHTNNFTLEIRNQISIPINENQFRSKMRHNWWIFNWSKLDDSMEFQQCDDEYLRDSLILNFIFRKNPWIYSDRLFNREWPHFEYTDESRNRIVWQIVLCDEANRNLCIVRTNDDWLTWTHFRLNLYHLVTVRKVIGAVCDTNK